MPSLASKIFRNTTADPSPDMYSWPMLVTDLQEIEEWRRQCLARAWDAMFEIGRYCLDHYDENTANILSIVSKASVEAAAVPKPAGYDRLVKPQIKVDDGKGEG